jgi:hypothetical protein
MVVGLLSHLSMFQTIRDANHTIYAALDLLQSLSPPCRILLRTAELPRPYDLKNGVSVPPQQHVEYEQMWGRGKLRLGLRRSMMLNEMARRAARAAGVAIVEGEAFTAPALHLHADNLHPYCKVSGRTNAFKFSCCASMCCWCADVAALLQEEHHTRPLPR